MGVVVRAGLTTMPARIAALKVDERGYPVPWFVEWKDGKPDFRVMDAAKWVEAIRHRKCWVCGSTLGVHLTFVAGPMCGINRTSSEPPCHHECARWSAINCPFLSNPHQARRPMEGAAAEEACSVGGFAIKRNPGVTMLWSTRSYDVFPDGMGGRLLHMGEAESVEWFCEGRPATREEVLRSIEGGFPALAALAQTEIGAMEYLIAQRAAFEAQSLPGEP